MAVARERSDQALLAVVVITAVALVIRFLALGDRAAHWDEARVAYWTLDFIRTGSFEYRPIIHGPFYHHVNSLVYATLGYTDGAMRVAPALVGGLLPLTALLFRDRLRSLETVALAGFLALSPVLLYYSRFMRGDPLVGAFMFAAFAFFVRAIDTGNQRHVVAGFLMVALGFTTKENALVYILCWGGALVLLLYLRLYSARFRGVDWRDELGDAVDWATRGVRTVAPAIVAGLAVFLVVIVYFYAPRSADPTAIALNNVASSPGLLPDVVYEATVGSWQSFFGLWVSGGLSDHAYLPYLGDLAQTLAFGGAAVSVLGLIGFLIESVASEEPRPIVLHTFFWGFASLLGYPIITDIMAPWAAVHVVLPLTIPAAVGIGLVLRWGHEAFVAEDRVSVGLAAVVVLLVVGQVAGVGVWAVYLNHSSADNELVQYAQPRDDIDPTMTAIGETAQINGGTDLLLYGEFFVKSAPPDESEFYPACGEFFNALPLPWYYNRSGMVVDCAAGESELDDVEDTPPVVVSKLETRYRLNGTSTEGYRDVPSAIRKRFSDYEYRVQRIRTTDTDVIIAYDPDRVDIEGGQPIDVTYEEPPGADEEGSDGGETGDTPPARLSEPAGWHVVAPPG